MAQIIKLAEKIFKIISITIFYMFKSVEEKLNTLSRDIASEKKTSNQTLKIKTSTSKIK